MAKTSGFIALLVLLCICTVHAMPGCNGGDTQSKYLKHVIKELGLEPSDIMSVIRPGGTGPHSGCAVDIKGFLGKRVHIDEPAESLVVTVGQILNSLPGTLKTTKTIGGKQVDTFEHLCYEIGFPRKKDKCKIPNSETNECLDLAGDVFFPAYCNDNGFGGAHQPVRVGRLLTTMSNRSKEQVASSINTLINKGGAIHNMFPDGPDHLHIEVRPTNKFPGGCRMDFSDTRLLSGCGRAVKGEKDKEEDIKKRNVCMDNCAAQFAKAVADGPKTPKKLQFCLTLTVPTEDPENPDAGGFFVKSRSTSPVDPAPPGLKPFCFFGVDLPRMREVSPAVNGVAKEVTVTSYGAADAPAPAVQKCNKQFVIPEHLNPQCVDLNKCENCSFNNNGDNPQANCIRGACPGPKNIVCCFNAKMK